MHTLFQASSKKIASAAAMAMSSVFALGFTATEAQAIPTGWTCAGNCGTSGANGVVTAPPSGSSYDWISTNQAPGSTGLGLGGETNGSTLKSGVFGAQAGDNLTFYFNYVTSDGAGFSDYAWARLVNTSTSAITYLLTARTQPSGSIIPGTGLPAIDATLNPASVPIIPGGPAWAPLGGSSGSCYAGGCGYTGWVQSDYTIAAAGNYQLEFGVVNWNDSGYDSGLALSGAALNDTPIGGEVPEPASALLIAGGIAGLLGARRRSRKT